MPRRKTSILDRSRKLILKTVRNNIFRTLNTYADALYWHVGSTFTLSKGERYGDLYEDGEPKVAWVECYLWIWTHDEGNGLAEDMGLEEISNEALLKEMLPEMETGKLVIKTMSEMVGEKGTVFVDFRSNSDMKAFVKELRGMKYITREEIREAVVSATRSKGK